MAILNPPTFISLALCTVSGWLYFSKSASKRPKLSHVLILCHTLYLGYQLLVAFPINVFRDTHSPLNAGGEMLRARYARKWPLDAELEGLFQKLGSVDMRMLYIRFGHDVVAGCDYCQSYTDYALLALPRPLLSYIREMAFIGALTFPGTPRAHLRSLGLAILMLAAVAEAYFTLTTPVVLSPTQPQLITYWHDTLLLGRLLLFLLLPFTLYFPRIPYIHHLPLLSNFLPAPAPPNRIPTGRVLKNLQPTLDHLLPGLQLLKYTRSAIMRVPSMRERASAWWGAERQEGDVGLADEGVRKAAKGSGLGYDEGEDAGENGALRQSAKQGLEGIMTAVRPSEHWRPEQ